MKDYVVTWKIDMEGDSPEEAAARALITMQDPESTALVFEVREHGTTHPVQIDLNDF